MASSAAPDGPRPVQGCVAFARRPAPTSAPPRLLSHVAGSPYPCADKGLRDRRRGGAESPSVGLRYRQPLSPQHMAYRLMEEVLDKLQLLDYEKKFCEERNEPALTKTAFAVASQNPRHAARRWPTSPPRTAVTPPPTAPTAPNLSRFRASWSGFSPSAGGTLPSTSSTTPTRCAPRRPLGRRHTRTQSLPYALISVLPRSTA